MLKHRAPLTMQPVREVTMAAEDITTKQLDIDFSLDCREEWRPIAGYEGIYEVSSSGRVQVLDRVDSLGRDRPGRVMKLWKRDRYFVVDLFNSGIRDTRSVHRLVYEAFVGDIPDGFHVHHKDENKDNNVPNNLDSVDGKEHVSQHGTGRVAWNKGTEYGKTEAYKKSTASRMRNRENQRNQ